MVYDKNYFLDQLRNGASIDALGQSIADAMNEAVEAHNAEVAAAKAAEAAAAAKTAEVERYKRELAMDMVDLIKEYGYLVAPQAGDILDSVTDEDIDMMVHTLDEMFNMMRAMVQLKVTLEQPAIKGPKSDDEVLNNFIASLM